MLKTLLIVIFGVLVVFLAGGFLLPAEYMVERNIVIAAEPAAIHAQVADLETWPKWTAWTEDRDPSCKWSFEGPKSKAGAVMSWSGTEMGQGRLESTGSDPTSGVQYDLAFDEGKYNSKGGIRFEPQEDGTTNVVWFNGGDLGSNPIGRYMGLLLDNIMGTEFEQNLANLKEKVEQQKGG